MNLVRWNTGTENETAVICIPWAGAGAAPFHSWATRIGDAASLYGVRFAGRESRQIEPFASCLDEAVAELVESLRTLGAPQIVLFGHCSGALTAFETARALRRSGEGPEVAALVVASQLPPRAVARAAHGDGDQDLARYVPEELQDEPELLEVLLPILTADMKLVADYAYEAEEPLSMPLTVVYGSRDADLGPSEVDGWRLETSGVTEFVETADADHLFSGASWLDLAATVRAALS